jgi:hypothetical protein
MDKTKMAEEDVEKNRKKKAVMKTQMWRMKINMANEKNETESPSREPFSRRWSEFRAKKKVEQAMPATPAKKKVYHHLHGKCM